MDLLVCGSAPCLFVDLERAKKLAGRYEVMLVNGACVAVEDAQHVLAGHMSKAEEFARARENAFPFALPWRLHATRLVRREPEYKKYPSVTDWWGPEMSSGATSAGKASLIGLAMGFDRVVWCGCPLEGTGYFPGESQIGAEIKHEAACQRIGDPTKQQASIIRGYKRKLEELAQTTFKGRVFSMSGYSRKVLGHPCESGVSTALAG